MSVQLKRPEKTIDKCENFTMKILALRKRLHKIVMIAFLQEPPLAIFYLSPTTERYEMSI